MHRRVRLLSIALILGFIPSLFAQSVKLDKERMMQVVRNYVDNRTFMGAVLVAEGDRIVVSRGFGYADLDWSIPNTVDSRFRIGSLTKQFTAASILLLRERGQLNLNAPEPASVIPFIKEQRRASWRCSDTPDQTWRASIRRPISNRPRPYFNPARLAFRNSRPDAVNNAT